MKEYFVDKIWQFEEITLWQGRQFDNLKWNFNVTYFRKVNSKNYTFKQWNWTFIKNDSLRGQLEKVEILQTNQNDRQIDKKNDNSTNDSRH